MFEQIRDAGPVVLVPGAWLAAATATFGYLGEQGMFIAHLVMATFIAVFAVTGWREMASGALRVWRLVLVVGFGLTLAGIAGFLGSPFRTTLLTLSLVGWMILPAGGLAYTGREIPDARLLYTGSAVLSAGGAVLFLVSLLTDQQLLAALGFVLAGAGQTAGIVDAHRR